MRSCSIPMCILCAQYTLLQNLIGLLCKTNAALLQTMRSLQPVLRNILQQQPLKVHIQGLKYMNDDPSAMHVAYVGVQDPAQQQGCVQKLQQLCTAVVDAFSDSGLLLSRDDR